ncbi:MAG: transcription termination/antitermination protein NusA [Parcubacteria group bacterium]|nr:transcription termination/antitermination protein NusA [Parcubacteria group bacterium]
MVDLKQFISAIDQIAEEKGIPKEKVVETIEMALAAAYKKDYGEKGQNIRVKLEEKTGEAKFFQVMTAVDESMIFSEEEIAQMERERAEREAKIKGESEEPTENTEPQPPAVETVESEEEEQPTEDKKFRFNPKRHIMLAEAQKIKPGLELGGELLIPLETKEDYGRIAAQTAKQVIIQRIREAEREVVYETFKEKEGDILSASVQRIERGTVYLDIGRTTGVLFPEEQIPQERYRIGQRLRVFMVRVDKDNRGPAIILSRKHPKIVAKLFELEVPEIASGAVEIKAIAREAGSRSKVAVSSNEPGIDPVGSCVGQRGIRVTSVINELGGENVDIVAWSEDPAKFIANSLSPAKVLNVDLNEAYHMAVAEVTEDQLSLAIGKRGQNVRLAAELTGWKIDIKSSAPAKPEPAVGQQAEETVTEEKSESAPEIPNT